MTLWNVEFLYPKGTPSFFISPVQNCRKFSAVRGTMSAYNSIRIRPKIIMVKYKFDKIAREKFEGPHGHLPISTPPTLTSKKTTGLWGCRSWPGKINVTFKIIGKQKIIRMYIIQTFYRCTFPTYFGFVTNCEDWTWWDFGGFFGNAYGVGLAVQMWGILWMSLSV